MAKQLTEPADVWPSGGLEEWPAPQDCAAPYVVTMYQDYYHKDGKQCDVRPVSGASVYSKKIAEQFYRSCKKAVKAADPNRNPFVNLCYDGRIVKSYICEFGAYKEYDE